jgi:hypothetical protein
MLDRRWKYINSANSEEGIDINGINKEQGIARLISGSIRRWSWELSAPIINSETGSLAVRGTGVNHSLLFTGRMEKYHYSMRVNFH